MYIAFKRLSDICFSLILIILTLPIQCVLLFGSSISTKSFGVFIQTRIGYKNREFLLFKFKSMKDVQKNSDFHTSLKDPRITKWGKLIRRSKLDELPQLFNVLKGDMSFVGPRPDVKGYAENLNDELSYLHLVRPGITSPASVFFRNEEIILSSKEDKNQFNDKIIWPLKAKMNREYAETMSFHGDLKCLMQTLGVVQSEEFKDES